MTSLLVQSKGIAKIEIECGFSVQRLKTKSISITKIFTPICFSWCEFMQVSQHDAVNRHVWDQQ